MKKTYAAPAVSLQRFVVSDNIAGCPTEYEYEQVRVDCIISTYDYVFYDSCDNDYSDVKIVEIESAIGFASEMDAINYLSGSGNYQYGNGYTLAAGNYMVWQNNQWHAGLVTPDVTATVNSSV